MRKNFMIWSRLLTSLFLFLMTLSVSLFSADLSGTWTGWLPPRDGDTSVAYTFAVKGDSLSGTMQTPDETMPIADGRVIDSNNFTFNIFIGSTAIGHYCTVSGDSLMLTIEELRGPDTEIILLREPANK